MHVIHAHTHTHIHLHTYAHTRTPKYTSIHTCTYIHTHTRRHIIHTCTHVDQHMYICTHSYIHAHMYIHTFTRCKYAYTLVYTCACIYTLTHIHTHIHVCGRWEISTQGLPFLSLLLLEPNSRCKASHRKGLLTEPKAHLQGSAMHSRGQRFHSSPCFKASPAWGSGRAPSVLQTTPWLAEGVCGSIRLKI